MKIVAQKLQAKLSARGFEVQNSDGATMRESCEAANAWPADIFISLHTNARGSVPFEKEDSPLLDVLKVGLFK